jgi:hypothetical protein
MKFVKAYPHNPVNPVSFAARSSASSDVNLDAVAYLQEFRDHTAIHFVGGLSAEGKAMIVGVKEKPDTIHLANPLHAA